ncbi:helix-turn-helix domain-containing protein [Nonomuraea wenchangensis]|uniref:helix-turn-helix domain-containing protein n=1 Tax=Nonomuraea wenchangensis TaxID=568860 RepID=UPI0033283AD1
MTRRHPVVEQLVRRRQQLGWSQAELAARLNRTVSAVSHFENDPGGRNYAIVEEIAYALGLRIEFTPVKQPRRLREAS